jgi:hypothetical protein
MAITPRPPVPGLINFDHTYGHTGTNRDLDTFAKPVHIPQPTPTELPAVLVNIAPVDDAKADRAKILAAHGGHVDEAVPALLGLRTRIVERRIEAKQTKLEELAHRQKIAKHVGEAVIRDKSYSQPHDPERPHTVAAKHMARRLEKVHAKRREEHGHAHAMSSRMHGGTATTILTPKGRPSRDKIRDRYNIEEAHRFRNLYNFTKTVHEADHLDHQFASIIGAPSQKADKVRDKRDELVVKAKALENAQVSRQNKKDDKRALKELGDSIYGSSWTDGNYGYQVASKNKDGSITITAFDASGPIADRTVRPRDFKKVANGFGGKF